MNLICSDLEGVFIPEIWINVAEKTGIEQLKLTTRDISDYDVLMQKRLSVMAAHGLKLKDITDVIATMDPLDGALETLNWIRERNQIIILSDTFEEFARPLMKKLNYPALLCHSLTIGPRWQHHGLQPETGQPEKKCHQGFQSFELQNHCLW